MSISRDLVSNMSAVASLAPKARTTSENGAGVDLRDYRSAAVVVVAGAITDGTHTIEIQDSADNSTFAPVAAAYLQGTEPVLDTNDDDSLVSIGYIGGKRYIRVVSTVAEATTGGVYGALVVRGRPVSGPVS